MCNLDLQDAYFLVPVHKNHRKYLRFNFNKTLYQFTCLPFGLSSCPYIFTKILKPVIAHLRSRGFASVIYLDDIFCVGKNKESCRINITETIKILEHLGFIINYKKSNLIPSHICKFLGFEINSKNFSIQLPKEKRIDLIKLIDTMINKSKCSIQKLAQLIGKLVAACPAIEYGWLHTKTFEKIKIDALKINNDNYKKIIILPKEKMLDDLNWWKENLKKINKFY